MMAFHGLALGCGNFGGVGSAPEFFGQGIDEETAMRIMDAAWAGGIRWFDTGDAYGGGRSETYIGRWLREHKERPRLTTKVFHSTTGTPGDEGLAPDRIRRQLEGSLERLGVDSVDVYLAHAPDDAVPIEQTIATFEALQAERLIGAWGLSNYDERRLRDALAVSTPALLQNSYSLLDREDEQGVLPLCAKHDISYVPFGPLAGGWLTGKYRRGEPFPEGSRMTQRPGP
ncbi:MAG TPA: aldo/keto reductase, partial [Gaiellaceae bacterium]